MKEFEARILGTVKFEEGTGIILDRTAFYPTSGGQPADKGTIKIGDHIIEIVDVRMVKGVIIHVAKRLEKEFKTQDFVKGVIDWNRRYALMRNHTAAHLMSTAVRKTVGTPLAIVGSALNVEKARLDFAYKSSLRPLFPQIEEKANKIIQENRPVKVKVMARNEAEKYLEKFGEDLKILPASVQEVRIVEIEDWHACACGGTHVKSTGEIGSIKLLKRSSKGKGVERIEFAAAQKS